MSVTLVLIVPLNTLNRPNFLFSFFAFFVIATFYRRILSSENLLQIPGSLNLDVGSVFISFKLTPLLLHFDSDFHYQFDFIVAITNTFSLNDDLAFLKLFLALFQLSTELLTPCRHNTGKRRLKHTDKGWLLAFTLIVVYYKSHDLLSFKIEVYFHRSVPSWIQVVLDFLGFPYESPIMVFFLSYINFRKRVCLRSQIEIRQFMSLQENINNIWRLRKLSFF